MMSACLVVSLMNMSILTIKSNDAKASSIFLPLGTDNTGLPHDVMNAFICPSPGVSMSSAMVEEGNSPPYSGNCLTRLCHLRNLLFLFLRCAILIAGEVNIAPPGLSKFPVSTLITLIAQ